METHTLRRTMFHVLIAGTLAALASHKAAALVEESSASVAKKADASEFSSGLWVCDPTIRRLLESAPASVSRGEILGRCQKTYTAAACTAAQNAIFRGSSVIANLELLCGPQAPGPQVLNAGAVGAGPYRVGYSSSVGFGPLGTDVKVPGANAEPHTSFRGPISPPLTNVVELDKTTKGKVLPRKFSWEKPSRSNSSGIDAAAEAVRVFDAGGLAGGSAMQGAGRLPISIASRATDVTENPMNATDISMNVTPVLPVDEQVVPDGEAVQAAGNEVILAPYAYAPYEGDWEDNEYWEATGPLVAPAPSATSGLAEERQQHEDLEADVEETPTTELRKPKLTHVRSSVPIEEVEDGIAERQTAELEETPATENETIFPTKGHRHRRRKNIADGQVMGTLDVEPIQDELLLRAIGAVALNSTDSKAQQLDRREPFAKKNSEGSIGVEVAD